MRLTIGGADEGEAGDDPEEGHGSNDDDVPEEQTPLIYLDPLSVSQSERPNIHPAAYQTLRGQRSHESHTPDSCSLIGWKWNQSAFVSSQTLPHTPLNH